MLEVDLLVRLRFEAVRGMLNRVERLGRLAPTRLQNYAVPR